jgi:hypothetical protein
MSDDIAAFLAARLGELAAAAKAATPGRWSAAGAERNESGFGDAHVLSDARDEHDGPVASCFASPYEGDHAEADAVHIALNDPESTLAGIAADRRILTMYEHQYGYDLPEGVLDGRDPRYQIADAAIKNALEQVVKIRAARFSGHPGYRPEWKP